MRRHAFAAGALVIGSGVALALTGIAPALAGTVSVHGVTTQVVTTTVTAPANDTAQAEAACPAGQLLTGGGYSINSTATDWQVYVDAPLNNTTWLVEPVNLDASQTLSFSAYAICAMSVPGKKGVTGYTTDVVDSTVNVPANDTGEADASCPAGQLLTGGGYTVDNVSPNWSVYSNAPLNLGAWNVEIDNEVPVSTTFDSFAICLAKTNGKPVTAFTNSTVNTAATVPANGTHTADVSCAAKHLMTGGGHVMASVGQDWRIDEGAPVSVSEWQVQAAALDNVSRDFDSIAVCLEKA